MATAKNIVLTLGLSNLIAYSQPDAAPALAPSSMSLSPDGQYVVVSCLNAPILMVYSLPNLQRITVADLPKPALGLSFAHPSNTSPGSKLYVSMEGPEYLLAMNLQPDGALVNVESDDVVGGVVKYAVERGLEGYKMDASDEQQAGGAAGLAKKQIWNRYWNEIYVRRKKQKEEGDQGQQQGDATVM